VRIAVTELHKHEDKLRSKQGVTARNCPATGDT
jgi:hypothetical protein